MASLLFALALVAALCHHVGVVICICANPQMRRIDARRIITGVTNVHTIWDRAVMQFVGESVRVDALLSRKDNDAVPVFLAITRPEPAFIGRTLSKMYHECFMRRGITVIVPVNKPYWLPSDLSAICASHPGNGRGTTAAAFAKFGELFNRGMISHVDYLLRVSAKARGALNVAWLFLLGCYSCNCSTFRLMGQPT